MPDQRRADDVCYTLRPAVTLREKLGVGKKATQKATHSPIRMIPQEAPDRCSAKGRGRRTCLPGPR